MVAPVTKPATVVDGRPKKLDQPPPRDVLESDRHR